MAEYIEREALKNHLMSYAGMFTDELGFAVSLEAVLRGIDFQPAAGVAPVVRCKDCKHRGNHEVCPLMDIRFCFDGEGHMDEVEDDKTEDEFFCSYGDRKDGEG